MRVLTTAPWGEHPLLHASAHHSASDSLQWLRSIESPWGEHPLLHHPCEWPRLKREIVEVHKWAAQHGAPAHDGRNLRRYTFTPGEFSHPNLVAMSYLTTLAEMGRRWRRTTRRTRSIRTTTTTETPTAALQRRADCACLRRVGVCRCVDPALRPYHADVVSAQGGGALAARPTRDRWVTMGWGGQSCI